MLHRIREYIQNNGLIKKQHKLLLAVSGGIDSMVLLHLLLKEGYDVTVAHCNFQLRGKESDADEQFVKKTGAENKIPVFVKKFTTSKQAAIDKTGLQETARKLRYEWFAELMEQHHFDRLITAHQATDQLETILLNLSRGSGLNGLEGIRVKSGTLVRPLLFATRKEIETYAVKNNIRYREDSSNASDKYARNRIRLHVLPELLLINPQVVKHVLHTSEVVQQANEFIRAETTKWLNKHGETTVDGITIQIKPLIKHATPAFLLFQLISPFGFNNDQVAQLLLSIENQSGKIFRSATHQLLIDRNAFIIQQFQNTGVSDFSTALSGEKGKFYTERFQLKWNVKEVPLNLSSPAGKVLVDAAKLRFPLTLRTWKEGDKFQPLGMKGNKKLSDFLVDEKVNRIQKKQVLVLESAGEIVWVVNYRLANPFKVTRHTKSVVEFEYKVH
jgi:tRNA(Ile)-lysidine synthase